MILSQKNMKFWFYTWNSIESTFRRTLSNSQYFRHWEGQNQFNFFHILKQFQIKNEKTKSIDLYKFNV